MLTFIDLETRLRSHQDELRREAARAGLRVQARQSDKPSQPIATFLAAIRFAVAPFGFFRPAQFACATCA